MLAGKKILIGITGSIAAYKIIYLVRLLKKQQAEVKVIMTEKAADFVSPLVLETLSGNAVLESLAQFSTWSNHVMLGRWADLMIIAPASCHTMAKMAHGICDNLLLAVYLSATCPVWIAPAMDEDMWKHPSTHSNINLLQSYGNKILDVAEGELASGLFGPGRMMEPEEIINAIEVQFRKKTFAGKRVLITAGPTYENIDPVRFIGNYSTGKMGFAIAEAFYKEGADVTLITGPVSLQTHYKDIQRIDVVSAKEMLEAVAQYFSEIDIAVFSAAVADYYVPHQATQKIKKQVGVDGLNLELKENQDILKTFAKKKSDHQYVIGFALETNNALENAEKKLKNKYADMIILNSLEDKGAGFATNTNKVTFLFANGLKKEMPIMSKKALAVEIVQQVNQQWNEI